MASLLERKKLIGDAINKTTKELCDKVCDSDDNTGYCASPCHSVCPDYCRYPSPLPEPPITSHHKNSALLIAMFSLLAATVLVICLYVAYVKYRKSRRRRRQREARVIQPDEDLHFDEDQGPVIDHPIWYINTVGLQPSVINSIMVFKYKKGDGLVEGTECSVCLNEFQEDETLRLLPKCSHAFHIPCIDTWLRSHTNCPMCRAPIVANTVRAQTVQQEYGNQSQEGEESIGEENSLGSGDGNRDVESGVEELRVGIEEDDEELEVEDRRKTTEVDDNEIQPLRRSISLDSLAACKISLAVSNVFPAVSGKNSDTLMEKFKGKNSAVNPKRVGSSSAGRSLQAGPGLMRRSLSLSGQILSSMYGRSQNSVLPL